MKFRMDFLGFFSRTAAWLTAALLAASSLSVALAQSSGDRPAAAAKAHTVVQLRIDDDIEPILAEYVSGGIAQAARDHASLVLVTMDTPGGLSTSMHDIIQRIIESPVPVVVYVSPSGARAASAGFFILLSADVAAMAPGTHTGAASPILAIGGYPVQIDETLRKKVLNDATAYLRSITSKRGRNVQLAESAVTEAKAFTEKESLDGKLVDLLARSSEDLLAQLNGRTIMRFDGSTMKLELENPVRVAVEMSARQKFLSRIVQPDVFFILLIVGVLGLYTEFTHPGMIAPGVVGAIALVLALLGMNILPVNFTGVLLILVALALFILEAKYTSHGVLGIGGVVAMLLGALMLVRSPLTSGGVSLGVALGVTLPFALITILLMRLVLRSRRWKQSAGAEQLLGAEGEVTAAVELTGANGAGQGMVFVHGELWRAVAQQQIPRGARVRVVKVEGLTLHVEPAGAQPSTSS